MLGERDVGEPFGDVPESFGVGDVPRGAVDGLLGWSSGEVQGAVRAVVGAAFCLGASCRVEGGQQAGSDGLDKNAAFGQPLEPAELDLGGKTVHLRTWGPAHTREDQGVYLPEEKILFIGDLIECRSFPVLSFFPPLDAEVDAKKWVDVLDQIQSMDINTVVPGHGEIGDLRLLDRTREYLEMVQSETNRLADQGEDPEKIAAIVVPELIARYPDWDAPPDWLLAAGVQSVLAHRG